MVSTRQENVEDRSSGKPAINRARIYAFVIGFFVFVWLPFEDKNLRWVILFSGAIAVWVGVKIFEVIQRRWSTGLVYPTSGLLAGLCMTPIVLSLMVIKNGLHGHEASDFTLVDVVYVLQVSYIWVLAGTIIGLGLLLLSKSKQLRSSEAHANRS